MFESAALRVGLRGLAASSAERGWRVEGSPCSVAKAAPLRRRARQHSRQTAPSLCWCLFLCLLQVLSCALTAQVASIKVMWPRTEEEKRRNRNCGFIRHYIMQRNAKKYIMQHNASTALSPPNLEQSRASLICALRKVRPTSSAYGVHRSMPSIG